MNKMEIIKKLREELGAGIVDCQKAVAESNGDYEIAKDILRKKGLASAQKKSDRVTSEGLIGIKIINNNCFVVELNCETDFVAKNEQFTVLLENTINLISDNNLNVEEARQDQKIKDLISASIGTIGENIALSNVLVDVINKDEYVASYVHNSVCNNVDFKAGKMAVVVKFTHSDENIRKNEQFQSLASQIAMHVAASNPIALNADSVDIALIEREREIYKEQSILSGKPEAVIQKMIDGKMKKFLEENVLLEQILVTDGETKVSEKISQFNKSNSANIAIKSFARIVLGGNKPS